MSKYLAPSEDFSKGTAYMATFHSDHFGFKPERVKQFTLSLRFSQGEDALTGALSAGARELASPLSKDSSEQTQQMISKIIGSVVGQTISGDEGAKMGANIAYLGEVYNRQLHQDEIKFIKNNIKNFKSTNKDKTLYGKNVEYSDEKAQRLLTTTAKYMVNKDFKEKYDSNSQYAGINEFSKDEINNAMEYLKTNSQNIYITDIYKESMKSQKAFTATKKQFNNSDYTLDKTIGMEDNSFIFVPSAKIGKNVFNTGKQVSPIVIRKTGQVYDDITLGTIKQLNNIAPNMTNKYILDTGNYLKIIAGIEVTNDIFNESAPIPSNTIGTILSGIKNIKDLLKDENKMNDIKNILDFNENDQNE